MKFNFLKKASGDDFDILHESPQEWSGQPIRDRVRYSTATLEQKVGHFE